MALESHLEQLGKKHQQLEQTIAQEEQRPALDEVRIRTLKRQKLRIKDEIERLGTPAMSHS
ncbi:MAG: DUF465 domain-containing protein [Pseudomonadota bacterium]